MTIGDGTDIDSETGEGERFMERLSWPSTKAKKDPP